jgi:hypothetical protein
MSRKYETLSAIRFVKDADDNYVLIGTAADIAAAVAVGEAVVVKRETNTVELDTATMVMLDNGMAAVWPVIKEKAEKPEKPVVPSRPTTAVTPQSKSNRKK